MFVLSLERFRFRLMDFYLKYFPMLESWMCLIPVIVGTLFLV